MLAANNGECAVAADVVESVDLAFAIFDNEEIIASDCEPDIFSRLGKSLCEIGS